MSEECGTEDENGDIILPPLLNLNSGSLLFTDGIIEDLVKDAFS
jgi:hypothetical protein